MTSRKVLKDPSFRILGYIDTDRQGRQTLKDKQFRILGYYEPRDNLTKDKNFRLIGRGNLLITLL